MGSSNRVVWSDGLFYKPQHFSSTPALFGKSRFNQRFAGIERSLYGFRALAVELMEYLEFWSNLSDHAAGAVADGTCFEFAS